MGDTVGGASRSIAQAPRVVADLFIGERGRWALWIPVFLGVGIAAYFALYDEPAAWLGPGCLGVALMAVFCGRQRQAVLVPAWAAVLVSAGFSAAQVRTWSVAAPVLERKIGPVSVTGNVIRVEIVTGGRRLWLKHLSIDRLAGHRTPATIRIKAVRFRTNGVSEDIWPGDTIRIRAVLHPPSAPAAPGAFDFARRAYFQQLGAVGYAVSPPVLVRKSAQTAFSIALASLRQSITRTIYAALPGRTGAVAAALMTGERGAIPDDVLAAMRDSGLAHLLAISGLHIGLVGGLLFFAVRLSLVLCGRIALRYPVKKWAAVAALVGCLGYLLVSGATLPTQRAFLMMSLVMLAVLIDRTPISMNMVAWAAGAILLMAPESLMSVSFQMSFAAVAALVAVYETGMARSSRSAGSAGFPRRIAYYLAAVLLTTLVAGAATAPFALYHFNRIALYGMLANLIAVPLTALWVMPCAIAAFILMPFGFSEFALVPMAWGIDGIIRVAVTVQSLPGAVAMVPAMPPWGLGLVASGGLWVCLWRTRWRLLGFLPVFGGLFGITLSNTPDIIVSETGRLVAVAQADKRLFFSGPARGFVAETWARRAGFDPAAPQAGQRSTGRCDSMGCVYRAKGHVIAVAAETGALIDDCAIASIVVSSVPVRRWQCRGPLLVIDRFALWRNGAHAVWLESTDKVRLQSVGEIAGTRPWSRYPRRPARRISIGE